MGKKIAYCVSIASAVCLVLFLIYIFADKDPIRYVEDYDIAKIVKYNNIKVSPEECAKHFDHRWGEPQKVEIYEVVVHGKDMVYFPYYFDPIDWTRECGICGELLYGWNQPKIKWKTMQNLYDEVVEARKEFGFEEPNTKE
jgi:hypothetical protein